MRDPHQFSWTKEIGSVIQAVEDLNNQLTLINNTIRDDKNPVAYRYIYWLNNQLTLINNTIRDDKNPVAYRYIYWLNNLTKFAQKSITIFCTDTLWLFDL